MKKLFTIIFALIFGVLNLNADLAINVQTGKNVTMSINVLSGTAPYTYQWQKNNADIAGATLSSFTINSVKPTDNANYTVKVSNIVGSVISDKAVLTVTDNAIVQLIPQSYTARGQNNTKGEGIAQLFDNNTATKWLDFSLNTWVQINLASPMVLQEYSLTSANDFPLRDPVTWTLSGSNDGVVWTVIDTKTGQSWATRFLARDFVLATPSAAFSKFKFNFTSTQGQKDVNGDITQLAEIELFGNSPTFLPLLAPISGSVN